MKTKMAAGRTYSHFEFWIKKLQKSITIGFSLPWGEHIRMIWRRQTWSLMGRSFTGDRGDRGPHSADRGPQEYCGQKPMPSPAAIRFRTDSVVSLSKITFGVKSASEK